jgi:hypothetical protein
MLPVLLLALASTNPVQARLDAAAAAGEPLTARVIVALADNDAQGIAPVPATLGDGDDARNNLYWGARYGLKTFFKKDAGWRVVGVQKQPSPDVLERVTFERRDRRGAREVTLRVVAEAWRGDEIKAATEAFLDDSGDAHVGGGPHVVAYVGHNGLMDFDLPRAKRKPKAAQGEIVLACISEDYFRDRLSSPVVLTSSLLAPEGYVVEGAVRAALTGRDPRLAAAKAYAKYQKISVRAARRMFTE